MRDGDARASRSSSAAACARSPASSASCCCSSSLATIASILATAGLGLIAFVPLVGLAMVPLQVAAWLLRGFVFEYLALTALGAYLTQYRHYLRTPRRRCACTDAASETHGTTPRMTNYDTFLSRAAAGDAGVRHPPDGHAARAEPRHHLVRARLPGAGHVPVGGVPGDRARAAVRRATAACCSTGRRAATGRCSRRSPASWQRAASPTPLERLLVTTGSQQGLDLVARVLLDPGDVVLVELPTYTGAITAFRNVQAQMVGVPQEADGIDLEALDDIHARLVQRGPPRAGPLRRAELPEPDRVCSIGLAQAAAAARVGRAPRHADRRGRPVSRAVLRGLGDAKRTSVR